VIDGRHFALARYVNPLQEGRAAPDQFVRGCDLAFIRGRFPLANQGFQLVERHGGIRLILAIRSGRAAGRNQASYYQDKSQRNLRSIPVHRALVHNQVAANRACGAGSSAYPNDVHDARNRQAGRVFWGSSAVPSILNLWRFPQSLSMMSNWLATN